MYTHVQTCIHIYIPVHTYSHMYTHGYTFTYMCKHICTDTNSLTLNCLSHFINNIHIIFSVVYLFIHLCINVKQPDLQGCFK